MVITLAESPEGNYLARIDITFHCKTFHPKTEREEEKGADMMKS